MQCPLLYRFRVVDRLPEAPSPAAVRGTVVHAVLERLFDLPAPERTLGSARSLLDPSGSGSGRRSPSSPRSSTATPTARRGLARRRRGAARAAGSSSEDPTWLEPAERELYVETTLDDGLLLRGYVDRLDVAPDGADADRRLQDRARRPRALFEAKALFQMKFYALVLWRLRGTVPAMLQLVYLGNGEVLALRARRGRAAGHRAQGQGAVGGDRAGGADRRLAGVARAALRLVRPPGALPGLRGHPASPARGRRRAGVRAARPRSRTLRGSTRADRGRGCLLCRGGEDAVTTPHSPRPASLCLGGPGAPGRKGPARGRWRAVIDVAERVLIHGDAA